MAPETEHRLRVLHVLTTTQRRGAELSAVTLRDELRRRGHDAEAVALIQSAEGERLDVPALGEARQRLSGPVLRALRRRALGVDVVLAHGSTTLPACALGLLGSGTPFVYANIGDPLFWASSWSKRQRVKVLLSRAAGVAARSESARDDLVRALGVRGDRVRVISNGRDVARFQPVDGHERERARRALGLESGRRVVLVLGALSPEKRVGLAFDAVALVEDVQLVVAGDGPDRQALQAKAAVLDLPVRFLGSVHDVPAVLAATDVVLLTSESEGLPGALVEAGLSGLPAVATDVGFVRDVVVDGVTGLVVVRPNPADLAGALREALDRAPELGPAAREHCLRNFDMRVVAQRWEDLLLAALRGGWASVEAPPHDAP